MSGKAWGLLIFLALVILLFRLMPGEHILYILRGVYSSLPPGVIVLFAVLLCLCVWVLSSQPKTR